MKFYPNPAVSAIFFTVLIACPLLIYAQTGVRVTSAKATIHNEPDIKASLDINAQKGDIFEVQEVLGDWVSINLFSGGERFIKNKQVEVVHGIPPYPSDPAARSDLCIQVEEVRAKASKEAIAKYASDMSRQGMYEKMLFDKYMMNVFRESDIPAAHYSKLTECVDDGILPSVRIEN